MGKEDKDGFSINVYSPGNFIAREINIAGNVNISGDSDLGKQNGFTDEQIAQAIEAICGDGKPLNKKYLWAAVYWYLRWVANFPVKGVEFCERIAKLPFSGELEPACEYNNIRRQLASGFMNEDVRNMDNIKPSRSETALFAECRTVAVALAQELGKTALPKI